MEDKMIEQVERQIIELIATDRIDKPISSMSGKLKRKKPKLARAIDLGQWNGSFEGDRAYARLEESEGSKARGMKEGVAKFAEEFPRYGDILAGYIAEQRVIRETDLYFGMNEGCRITSNDYMGVMTDLGFTEATARDLYPELMDVSRNLAKQRDEGERSILVNQVI